MKLKYPLLLLFLVPLYVWGQKDIATQNNSWYMYFGNHKVTDKVGIHTEFQWRRNGLIKDVGQSLTRLGVDYKLSPSVMATAGYAYIVTWPYGEQPVAFKFREHRIWQQLFLTHSSGRFFFNHRFRLEQRFIEKRMDNGDGTSSNDGSFYKNRARYRFFVSVPLNNNELVKGTFFVSAYDEVFLQFGPNFGLNYLDQNRLYGAIGYVVDRNANVQLGYLNQFIIKGDAVQAENNHTLQLALTYNFDFRKNKE
ncbi:MAG: DUF2490 domain-containing protein [Cyclobacteriaceae bacterium]